MLRLYTDGSCLNNPGGAIGYAAVLFEDDTELGRHVGGAATGTNNTAELLAVITALEALPPTTLTVVSDSQYVVKGATEWMPGWLRKKMHGVKNVELWQRMNAAIARHKAVTFEWVRGHNGNPKNELVDELCGAEALKYDLRPKAAPAQVVLGRRPRVNRRQEAADAAYKALARATASTNIAVLEKMPWDD